MMNGTMSEGPRQRLFVVRSPFSILPARNLTLDNASAKAAAAAAPAKDLVVSCAVTVLRCVALLMGLRKQLQYLLPLPAS